MYRLLVQFPCHVSFTRDLPPPRSLIGARGIRALRMGMIHQTGSPCRDLNQEQELKIERSTCTQEEINQHPHQKVPEYLQRLRRLTFLEYVSQCTIPLLYHISGKSPPRK